MSDDPDRFDTIVVGAGQAGPSLASALDGRGERVALVEQGPFGGTCLNDGCRPTKALRASARAAHVARTAGRLGVHVDGVRVDVAEAVARKDRLIDAWRSSGHDHYADSDTISYVEGRARLAGRDESGLHRVVVGERTLRAGRVVLNTGARSVPPDIDGLDEVPWFDHHGILDVREAPARLVVVGGSYIGLELGQMFSRFGSAVTIVEHGDRLVGREDPEVSDAIAAFLRDEGIEVRTSTDLRAVARTDDGVAFTTADGGTIEGTHALVAVGRVPNSDDLGLGGSGVDTDERGYVVTDEHFATSVEGVFAVGDVNGRGAFTHTSYQDGEILADHLAGGDRSVAGRTTTYALFTDPPLGRVGVTEVQARRDGLDYEVTTFPMSQLTRAVLEDETVGIVKLLTDRSTGEFLGAACLGLHGDDLVQTISVLMHAGVPASTFATWLPIHPTMSEFFPTIVAGLAPPGDPA